MGIPFGKDYVYEEECELSTPVRGSATQGRFDPRSPSIGIDRTPIQHPQNTTVILEDPRSPSLQVTRTPIILGVKNEPECIMTQTCVEPSLSQQETPIPEPEATASKECIKQKLQFDSTPPPSRFPAIQTRSPLAIRNCYPEQPVEIVKRKQLQKVAERLNLDPAFADKENLTK